MHYHSIMIRFEYNKKNSGTKTPGVLLLPLTVMSAAVTTLDTTYRSVATHKADTRSVATHWPPPRRPRLSSTYVFRPSHTPLLLIIPYIGLAIRAVPREARLLSAVPVAGAASKGIQCVLALH